jgi:hypothetical protein
LTYSLAVQIFCVYKSAISNLKISEPETLDLFLNSSSIEGTSSAEVTQIRSESGIAVYKFK